MPFVHTPGLSALKNSSINRVKKTLSLKNYIKSIENIEIEITMHEQVKRSL